jgi:hypothetical protein
MEMTNRFLVLLAIIVVIAAVHPGQALGQQFELSPYAGGFWPTETLGDEDFKDEELWGVRMGGFVTDHLMIDGNVGYADEFSYTGTVGGTNAWLWDVNTTLHFFPWDINLSPFLVVGAGGLTATLDDADTMFFLFEDDGGFLEIGDPEPGVRAVRMDDGDTFFGFNYGGGLKATELLGPVGFRFDLRGRTLPNFYGEDLSWLEATGGLTISWGER